MVLCWSIYRGLEVEKGLRGASVADVCKARQM